MDTLDRQVDGFFLALRVEFLLITESGYLRDDLVFFSEVLGGGGLVHPDPPQVNRLNF